MSSKVGVLQVLIFMTLSNLWGECGGDVFSAMFKMEHLLDTRQRVIHKLNEYIHREENRLRELKMYSTMYKREHERAMKDMTHYTGNPINAFILIKRLTSDLDDIEKRINKTTEFVSVRNVSEDDKNVTILYPTAVDLQGAALALKRLQRTYKLKVEDLARGVLNGRVYSDNRTVTIGQPLTASDCYKLGLIMLGKKDYLNALAWQMEALRKYKLEDSIPHSITEINIMEHISILYNHLGDQLTALDWAMKILEFDPSHKLAKKNIVVFEQILEDNREPETEILEPNVHKKDTKAGAEIENRTDFGAAEKYKDEIKKDHLKTRTDVENGNNTENETKAKYHKHTDDETENAEIEVEIDAKNYNDGKFDSDDADVRSFLLTEAVTVKNGSYANSTPLKNETSIRTGTDANNDEFENETDVLNSFIDYRRDEIMVEALCRGEYDIAREISSKLTCHYLNDKPFLKLAPMKAEQRYINPDVFLFHDVISDEEIEHVKNMAKPYFQRATVIGTSENSSYVVDYRISQSSWLSDEEDEDHAEVIPRLTQRVSDFTGLKMEYVEELQVANYGVGGHYELHLDYIGETEDIRLLKKERIATAMFYMSDVTQGGATVFPKLGLSVFPVKGSAIFWMNLLPSGEGNQNTRHAACPVLQGYKWVANKWINLLGQEFIKPCNLEYQREEMVLKQPAPVPKPESLVDTSAW